MNATKIVAALLIVVAVILAGLAWMLSRQPKPEAVQAGATTVAPQVQTYPAVVAARAIPAGQAIVAEDLKVTQLPIRIEGGFDQPAHVEGTVPMVDLPVDVPIFSQQLVQGFSTRIAEGERAVSIKVDETMAAGNRVQAGDFVDVYFTLDQQAATPPPPGSTATTPGIDRQTRLLLARKRVLAYGVNSVEGPSTPREEAATPRAARNTAPRGEAARTAVLAVQLDDIERLSLGEQYGKLTLALRNPTDTAMPDASLFAQLPPALMPVAVPGQRTSPPPLQGLDRSYAGLRFDDLAKGGAEVRRPTPTPAPRLRAASSSSGLNTGSQVEILRGGESKTVRY